MLIFFFFINLINFFFFKFFLSILLNLLYFITEKSLCFLMDHICFDLDHEIDFDIMNYLIKNNKLGFKL